MLPDMTDLLKRFEVLERKVDILLERTAKLLQVGDELLERLDDDEDPIDALIFAAVGDHAEANGEGPTLDQLVLAVRTGLEEAAAAESEGEDGVGGGYMEGDNKPTDAKRAAAAAASAPTDGRSAFAALAEVKLPDTLTDAIKAAVAEHVESGALFIQSDRYYVADE